MKNGYSDVFPKRELWEAIRDKFNARFEIRLSGAAMLEIHRMWIPYKQWEIFISESDTRPLKFEIVFNRMRDFEMTISEEGFIDKVMKKLGKNELEIGYPRFDKKYLVESHDFEAATSLLTEPMVDCFLKHNIYSLSYASDANSETSRLITAVNWQVKSTHSLEELIQMHFDLIDRMKALYLIA